MKIAVTILLLAAGGAHAQVYKCVDADWKVEYRTAPCPTSAKQSKRVLSQEDTRPPPSAPQPTRQALDAFDRASAIGQSLADGAPLPQAVQGPIVMDAGRTTGGYRAPTLIAPNYDEQLEPSAGVRGGYRTWSPRRGYGAPGGPSDQWQDAEATPPQAPPRQLYGCGGGYCYDTSGGSYRSNGDGMLLRSGGGTCRPVPGVRGQFNCD